MLSLYLKFIHFISHAYYSLIFFIYNIFNYNIFVAKLYFKSLFINYLYNGFFNKTLHNNEIIIYLSTLAPIFVYTLHSYYQSAKAEIVQNPTNLKNKPELTHKIDNIKTNYLFTHFYLFS